MRILRKGFGFLLECAATWKASLDRATNVLGLTEDKWRDLVTKSNKMMGHIKNQLMVDFPNQDIQIGGLVGAREGKQYNTTSKLLCSTKVEFAIMTMQVGIKAH